MQSFSYESNALILTGMAFVNTKKRTPERLLLLLRGMFTEYTRTRLYLFVAPTCAAA